MMFGEHSTQRPSSGEQVRGLVQSAGTVQGPPTPPPEPPLPASSSLSLPLL